MRKTRQRSSRRLLDDEHGPVDGSIRSEHIRTFIAALAMHPAPEAGMLQTDQPLVENPQHQGGATFRSAPQIPPLDLPAPLEPPLAHLARANI